MVWVNACTGTVLGHMRSTRRWSFNVITYVDLSTVFATSGKLEECVFAWAGLKNVLGTKWRSSVSQQQKKKITHVRPEKPVILEVFVLQLNLQVYIAQDFGMQNDL